MKSRFRMLLAAITFFAGLALLFAELALPLRLAAQDKTTTGANPLVHLYYGECQVDDTQSCYHLFGSCVSHLPFPPYSCFIQPSANCTGTVNPVRAVVIYSCFGNVILADPASPCTFYH
jgi:hypothetical protein